MTALPLPNSAQTALASRKVFPAANLGLYWAKFFDRWQPFTEATWRGVPDGEKRKWLDQFANKRIGDQALLDAHIERRRALVSAQRGGATRSFQTRGEFVTGTGIEHPIGTGFAFQPTLGVPYLNAAGIQGATKAYATDVLHEFEDDPAERDNLVRAIARVFGRFEKGEGDHKTIVDHGVGSINFLDALPPEPVSLTIEGLTPHHGRWLLDEEPPADWIDPTPIPFLAVAEGTTFEFALMPNRGAPLAIDVLEADMVLAWSWLKEALWWSGAGAKTATGFGRFELMC